MVTIIINWDDYNNNMKKIQCQIGGMHCTSCVMLIEEDLEDCESVKNAVCNYAKGECLIEADDVIDEEKIKEIIVKDGYSVISMEEV